MKVLWIVLVWPEPDASAAGFRTLQLIKQLLNAGYDVEVCSPCKTNRHRESLEKLGISTTSYQPNDSLFDEYLKKLNPEIVFFDRFMAEEQFGWRVREQLPNALRVLDTVDLHSLRRARQKLIEESCSLEDFTLDAIELKSVDAIREISSIFRSDLSLIISDAELSLLKSHYKVPAELLELIRFYYPSITKVRDYKERRHFVAIGNFNHPPNVDSYKVLHNLLWDKIRDELRDRGVFDVELHIYGAYPTKEFISLDNPKSGFRVKGWAKDALETLGEYRVNLAPLRYGAGIKGKISDGWAVGTPCVATEIANEGMCEGLLFGGAIASDKEDFIKEAVALYCDETLWNAASKNGLEIIRALYNEKKNTDSLLMVIRTALENLEHKRHDNFIGQMLWYHRHRSTEFFSRWIETKSELLRLKAQEGHLETTGHQPNLPTKKHRP